MTPDNRRTSTHAAAYVAMGLLLVTPSAARAQQTNVNTIQLAGLTGLAVSSGSTAATTDHAAILGGSSIGVDGDVSVYLAPTISFGGLVGYQRLSLGSTDAKTLTRASTSYYGPVTHLRLPLDERSAFVLTGSIGGVAVSVLNQRATVGDTVDLSGFGRYWLAGGGVTVELSHNSSLDLTTWYQSATFRVPGQTTRRVSARVMVGVGFSVYLS